MKFKNFIAVRNLRLVVFESAITAGLISMSIMTPFYYSIGLDNAKIALLQACFTTVVLLLNLPMGWVADRLSRKWANVIGDFGQTIAFLVYATADSFPEVVFCECLLGICISISQGVDSALLRHFSRKINPSDEFYQKQSAKMAFWQNVCTLGLVALGGPLGVINFRLAIALSGLPSFLGGVASLLIVDDSEKLQSTTANPFKDMSRIVKVALRRPNLRNRLFAYAIGREMTHGIIWVLTPMLLAVGMPLRIVSVAWMIDCLMRIVGARLASRYAGRLNASQIFGVPLLLMAVSMSIIGVRLDIWTIGFYLLMGVTCGWTGAALMPLVQEEVPPAEQATVISLAKVMGQILYIPVSLLIGWVADFQLRYAALVTLAVFLPLGLFAAWTYNFEEDTKRV